MCQVVVGEWQMEEFSDREMSVWGRHYTIGGIDEGTDETYGMINCWIVDSGIHIGDWEGMYQWFGQRDELGGTEVSRLVQMFHRIVKALGYAVVIGREV